MYLFKNIFEQISPKKICIEVSWHPADQEMKSSSQGSASRATPSFLHWTGEITDTRGMRGRRNN